MRKKTASAPSSTARQLAAWFDAHGWVQSPPKKPKGKAADSRHGYEVRLTASPREVPGLVRMLKQAGFKPGKPHAKGNRLRVPLYGREQVARFKAMIKPYAGRAKR